VYSFRRLLLPILLLTLFSGNLSAEFSANVTEAPVGSSVTLTWSSSANSCSALGEWSGTKSGSGSEDINYSGPGSDPSCLLPNLFYTIDCN